MTLTENAYSAIESTLEKATARYQCIEVVKRTFVIVQNTLSWDQKMIIAVKQFEGSSLPCQRKLVLWAPKQRTHSNNKNFVCAA